MRRLFARRRGDGGFTATEVVLVVVLLGLISAPLTAALMQGIKYGPQTGARSSEAIDRVFIADQFASDVANATSLTLPVAGGAMWQGCNGMWWPADLYTGSWDEAGDTYEVRYAVFVGGGAFPRPVIMYRFVTKNGAAFSSETIADGWCTSGTEVARVTHTVQGAHKRALMVLKLRPYPDLEIETSNFEGTLRKTF